MESDYDSLEDENLFERMSKDKEMEEVEELPNNIIETEEVVQDKVLDKVPQEGGDEIEQETIVTLVNVNRGEMEVEDNKDDAIVKAGNEDDRELYLL